MDHWFASLPYLCQPGLHPATRVLPLPLLPVNSAASSPSCSDITERHRRLAEIIEMIHTASLVHDDVLDDCSVRRGESGLAAAAVLQSLQYACTHLGRCV